MVIYIFFSFLLIEQEHSFCKINIYTNSHCRIRNSLRKREFSKYSKMILNMLLNHNDIVRSYCVKYNKNNDKK